MYDLPYARERAEHIQKLRQNKCKRISFHFLLKAFTIIILFIPQKTHMNLRCTQLVIHAFQYNQI